MGDNETIVLAYPDDIAVFCSNKESVVAVLELCYSFCKSKGAVVNNDKCNGIRCSGWDRNPQYFEGIRWTCWPSKYLGVPVTSNAE